MRKLETLKNFMKDLVESIAWFEENAHELDVEGADKSIADLYLFELNQLEEISQEIAQVTEWEQLGYHENKIVELYNEKFPIITEEIETIIVHHLGENVEKVLQVGNEKLIISTFFKNQLEKSYEIKNKSKNQIYEYLKKSWFMSEYEINNIILKMGV